MMNELNSMTEEGLAESEKIEILLNLAMERLNLERNNPLHSMLLKTGFDNLDEVISGWQPGEFAVISGIPSAGKTSFVTSMICNMAIKYDYPVALISLKQTEQQLANSILANKNEISLNKIKKAQLENFEWAQLEYENRILNKAPIYVWCPSLASISELCDEARKLVSYNKVKAVFIDYAQLIEVSDKSFISRNNELEYISIKLKAIAKELNIPIIVTSQLNKTAIDLLSKLDKVTGDQFVGSWLRKAETLYDHADTVCLVHRPEMFRDHDDFGNSVSNLIQLVILKHENEEKTTVRFRLKKAYRKFLEWDDTCFTPL